MLSHLLKVFYLEIIGERIQVFFSSHKTYVKIATTVKIGFLEGNKKDTEKHR